MDGELDRCLQKVAGLVLASSNRGERTFQALGFRQVFGLTQPIEMMTDTAFDLGSITKVVATTSALMALASQNAYSPDDRVAKYISEWNTSEKASVTIRDLLLHRSGLWEWRPLYIEDQDPLRVHVRIAALPLRYKVNEARHYSDLGFITLGKVLTSISGQTLAETVKDYALDPLRLTSTNFSHPAASSNVAATSWGDSIEREMVRSKSPFPVPELDSAFSGWREEILVGAVNDGNAFHLFGGTSSHAGLFSSASDLLTFGEALLSSAKGEGYFSPDVVKLFMTQGPDAHQSLGFRSWTDACEGCEEEFIGHTGFPGTVLAISFKHDFVATLLTNRLHVRGTPENTEDLWRPILRELHKSLHD